jgi:hypothetical protein
LLLLRWIVALPLGLIGAIGLGIVGSMAATGSSDGGRLALLLVGLGAGGFPWLLARAGSAGGVIRRGAIVLVLEALAVVGAGYAYPALRGRPPLGPESLQWLRETETFAEWATTGYGPIALAVICALVGALGLVVLLAWSERPAPNRTRSGEAQVRPATQVSAAPSASRPLSAEPDSAAALEVSTGTSPAGAREARPGLTAPPPASAEDLRLGADLASLREKLVRISVEHPPAERG